MSVRRGKLNAEEISLFTGKAPALQLRQKPEIVTWPETRYVYVEIIVPFQETSPQAWNELQTMIPFMSEQKIQMRDDFCIENYVNDPKVTPEAELVTQILIPTV